MWLRLKRPDSPIVWSLFCLAGALAAAGLAAHGVKLAISLWRATPDLDDWSGVQFYYLWIGGAATLGDLLAPHFEHRIPFTRLLFLIDLHSFRGRMAFAHGANLASYAALGATLGLVASLDARQMAERALIVATSVAFMLAPVQIFNLVYPFQLQMSLVCLFALLAFFATARLASPTTPGQYCTYVALAAVAAILAPFSSANGVIATVMTATLAWALSIGWRARVIITTSAALALAGFFHGFQIHPDSTAQLHPPPITGDAMTSFLGFLCTLLGSIGQYTLLGSIGRYYGPDAAMHLGVAGLAAWAAIVVASIVLWHRGTLDTTLIALTALATFAVGTALMIAFARGMNGLQQALFTRYGTFSAVFFASLLGCTWQLIGRAPAACHRTLKILVIVVGAKLLVDGYRLPLEFHALTVRVARVETAINDLRAGRYNTEPVRQFLGNPEGLRPLVEFLRARRLAFFAD
jgi:hypothetical protein